MKRIKYLIATCFFLSFLNCTEKKEVPQLPFSESTIVGVFNIQGISEKTTTTVVASGVEVEVAKTKSRADTFEVELTLNNDNTYSVSGAYRKINTVTPTGKSSKTSATIITITDSGIFSVDEAENKVTFSAKTKEFLEGTYLVTDFYEERFTLQKEAVTLQDQITTSSNIEITFVRR